MSCLDKVHTQLKAIEQHNDRLRALITPPDPSAVIRRAHELDQQSSPIGVLHGMTISLKDNIDTAGLATSAGAEFWRERIPSHDAAVVKRLVKAGAIVFGKANMTELAWGVRSYSAVGGQCRNPWDASRIPGGSSGGSGAAVAANFCTASLGTDTGGSIRLPAAFNGVVGLRPTYGRVSNVGVLPLSESHDTVGPLARTVHEVARIYSVIAGYDSEDPRSQNTPVPDFLTSLSGGVEGLVIGIPENYYFDRCSDEVVQAVMKAAGVLEKLGATLVKVQVPMVEDAQEMAARIMFSEVCAVYHERLTHAPETISTDIRERMMHGYSYTGIDYAQAVGFRYRWQRVLQSLYQRVDLMLMPATTQIAPMIDDGNTLYAITRDLARNTYVSSLAGIPSLAIPCGTGQHDLPIGMLLEGPWWHEPQLLRAGVAYQQASSWHKRSVVL